jgi:hypothetical protein
MCEPIAIAAAFAVTTAAQQYGQYQSAKAQVKAINEQNRIQADEIADAAGLELTERARAARRERGRSRAAASEAGINLGSGSFLAALQTSAINQSNDSGLILQNEKNQQRARDANYRSALSQIQVPTALSASLAIGASAAQGFYAGGASIAKGASKATGGGNVSAIR